MNITNAKPAWWRMVWSRRMVQCLLMGFSSGLPLLLLLQLAPAWLRHQGADLHSVALLALAQLPYSFKFVWAPFLDRYALNRLGRRRSWMLLSQILLLALIASLGLYSPATEYDTVALLCFLLALFSATQDIALDAYRREILSDAELGLGNVLFINAYRIAGLVPGSLSLILADHWPWSVVFAVTALFMLPGIFLTLWSKEVPWREPIYPPGQFWARTILDPFIEFIRRLGWSMSFFILAFLMLYKLGDSLAVALITPFYLAMGYSLTDIGLVAKNAGLWCSIAGTLVGGVWMVYLGIHRALWVFGVLQAVVILGFAWLAGLGPHASITPLHLVQLGVVVGLENFGVGMGTAASVAYIAKTTSPLFAATQFALLTSVASIPRTFFNAATGWMVEKYGWYDFFLLCFVLALPGLLLLFFIAPWRHKETAASANMSP